MSVKSERKKQVYEAKKNTPVAAAPTNTFPHYDLFTLERFVPKEGDEVVLAKGGGWDLRDGVLKFVHPSGVVSVKVNKPSWYSTKTANDGLDNEHLVLSVKRGISAEACGGYDADGYSKSCKCCLAKTVAVVVRCEHKGGVLLDFEVR